MEAGDTAAAARPWGCRIVKASIQKPRVDGDGAGGVESERVQERRVEWRRVGLLEGVWLRGWLRSGRRVVEGSGWVFIALDEMGKGILLRLVLLGPCRAGDVQVLQGLKGLEGHLKSCLALMEG